MWVDMIRESGPPNWASMQWYDAKDAFASGQAGMIADCDFFAAGYEDPATSKIAGKVGYALLPAGSEGKTYSGLWTWALGVNKAAKDKDAAWLFVQWATSPRTLLDATVSHRNYNPSALRSPRIHAFSRRWGPGRRQLCEDGWEESRNCARGVGTRAASHTSRRHLGPRAARHLLQTDVCRRSAETRKP